MALRRIRLELGRNADYPEGSASHGYAFVAPLTDDGHLDLDGWREHRADCTVRRFWGGEDDEHGHLVHHRGGAWAFHYAGMSEDDERTFRVAEVVPFEA